MRQVDAINIVWTPDHKTRDVEAEIELALEVRYFTNAWLQGKLSSADYLEYAEWREVDLVQLLKNWELTQTTEI